MTQNVRVSIISTVKLNTTSYLPQNLDFSKKTSSSMCLKLELPRFICVEIISYEIVLC